MSCRFVEIRFFEALKIDYFADHTPVFPADIYFRMRGCGDGGIERTSSGAPADCLALAGYF